MSIKTIISNQEITQKLRETAKFLRSENVWKARAFYLAAETVEKSDKIVAELDSSQLESLANIGPSIREAIKEIVSEGQPKRLKELKIGHEYMDELTQIYGVGPVRARQIFNESKCKSLNELRDAIKKGRYKNPIVERGLKMLRDRVHRTKVLPLVRYIMGELTFHFSDRFEVCGSWRRGKEMIKDIDILSDGDPKSVKPIFFRMADSIVTDGDAKCSILVKGFHIELKFVQPHQWGAGQLHLTGSTNFNARMRTIAIKMGWKLNEYGLWSGENLIASETEEEIFENLKVPYMEPKEREI